MDKPTTSNANAGSVLDVAIVADDLTGALDTAAPFAVRGLNTVVAISIADVDAALEGRPSVIAVNTASRHVSPEVAAQAVTHACARLLKANPAILFKKIDSRLKGNIEAETRAMLAASARDGAIVAPAVPELGRVVVDGKLRGRGVNSDISVAERFGSLAQALDIVDVADEASMAFVAARCLASAHRDLAVGARGLAAALAGSFPSHRSEPALPFIARTPVIIAIGSRDPITTAQVERLREATPGLAVTEAPGGVAVTSAPDAPFQLLLCTAAAGPASPEHEVAARFGRTVAKRVVACAAQTLIASGGDTVLGILRALGVRHIRVEGEVDQGMPWSSVSPAGLPLLVLVTKSGGFGGPDALLAASAGGRSRLAAPDMSGSSPEARDALRSMAGTSLADRVHHELAERIARGEYGAEGKLPSEHDLARMFGVSRPIVRFALGRLREEGLIYSRRGAGSFVRAPGQTGQNRHDVLGFTPIETIADIQRCFEFRLTIEPDAAFHAAQRRSNTDVDAIHAAIRGLEDATRRLQHRDDVDFIFHHSIAQASNNHYYVTAFTALHGHIAVGMRLHGLSLMNAGPKLEQVLREHLAIFHAVRDGKAEAAETAMRTHLEGSRDRLFEGRLLNLSSRDGGQ